MARLPNTMIFSRKLRNNGLYKGNDIFAKEVLRTSEIANSLEHHIELLEKRFPNYKIRNLWTYEHSGFALEYSKSCNFDSSADAFAAYKTTEGFQKLMTKINKSLEDF